MALNQQQQQQQQDVVEHKGANLVVHIRGDSDSELQALFDTVLKPDSKRPLQVPLRMRKLPNSFFNPPSTGSKSPSVSSISHSRENSSDSAYTTTTTVSHNGLQIHHPRAHSSPASLQQTYASAQQHQQHQHLKQQSYDITDDLGPLPPGWEQARTAEGQVYYLNHITRTTTWEDPRKSLGGQLAQEQSQNAANQQSQGGSPGPQTLGTLPDGWEQAVTPEGEVYFINHQTRTTSWFDPRIPIHLQRPAVLQQQQQQAQAQAQQSQASATTLAQTPTLTSLAGQIQPPITSLTVSNTQSVQARQQKMRLQRLQMERERLKVRQQEIMRQVEAEHARLRQQGAVGQELLLRQSLGEDHPSPTTEVPSAGLDPFLSGCSDFHPRQDSADSGLGMGNNYSLPHTPEDFLANMDENMDGVNEGGTTSESEMTGLEGPDITSLGSDNIDSTDDLVPSLQPLGDEFTSDILDDVESLMNTSKSPQDVSLSWQGDDDSIL